MKIPHKTPLTAIGAGGALWFLYMFFGREVDVAFCAIILFGTGLVAWTFEQYEQRNLH